MTIAQRNAERNATITGAPQPEAVAQEQPPIESQRFGLLDRLAQAFLGHEDPLAITRLSAYKVQQIVTFLACVRYAERCSHGAVNLDHMREWAFSLVKASLRTREDLMRMADNLSQPVRDETSPIERLFKTDRGGKA